MTDDPIIYRNQSIDLRSKAVDWFQYDRDLRHERVNAASIKYFRYTLYFVCPNKVKNIEMWKIEIKVVLV